MTLKGHFSKLKMPYSWAGLIRIKASASLPLQWALSCPCLVLHICSLAFVSSEKQTLSRGILGNVLIRGAAAAAAGSPAVMAAGADRGEGP